MRDGGRNSKRLRSLDRDGGSDGVVLWDCTDW